MGYETKIHLVEAPGTLFTAYHPKDEWFGHKSIKDDLPKGAQICDGGCEFASIKLSNIGSGQIYEGELDLPGLLSRNRAAQMEEKKYVALKWIPSDHLNSTEWPLLTDGPGEPYVISDAKEVLKALRVTIQKDKELEDYVSPRLIMLEGLLVQFIEHFPHGIVVSNGY